jgi:hypothetical protein
MNRHLRPVLLTCVIVAGAALAGCSGPSPAASPTATRTVTTTPSSTPAPSSSAVDGQGCSPNGVAIPSGAMTATVGDIDRDGKADQEFYTQSSPFEFGVHTASGATIVLKDDLAGPGTHSGWISHRETGTVAVIDDGRSANLWGFVDCSFVRTVDGAGKPYSFTLAGYGQYGTGVECTDENGGALLWGMLAAKQGDGTYTITETYINLVDDGRTAENNGGPQPVASGLAQTDPQVKLAMRSSCGDVPIVHTDGR